MDTLPPQPFRDLCCEEPSLRPTDRAVTYEARPEAHDTSFPLNRRLLVEVGPQYVVRGDAVLP